MEAEDKVLIRELVGWFVLHRKPPPRGPGPAERLWKFIKSKRANKHGPSAKKLTAALDGSTAWWTDDLLCGEHNRTRGPWQ